jgi:DNA-binding beta-propeller fold protein YncE
MNPLHVYFSRGWLTTLMAVPIILVGMVLLVVFAEAAPKPPNPLPPITVVKTTDAGRHPFGIAIHPGRAQALVANRNSKTASLIDIVSGAELWEIKVGRGPMGAAVNPSTNVGVVTLHDEGAVAIIDLTTRAVTKVPVIGKPAGVAVDSLFNVAIVAVQSGSVAIIDLASGTSLGESVIGKKPYGVALNPDTHVAAITNEGDGSITLLDYTFPTLPQVPATVSLPAAKPGPPSSKKKPKDDEDDWARGRSRPLGIAFDHASLPNRLVVADYGAKAIVIVDLDAANHQVTGIRSLDPLPDKGEKPVAVAVNPGLDYALVATHRDDVFAMSLTNPGFLGEIPESKKKPRKPRGVAIDPVTCRAVATHHGREPKQGGNVLILATPCAPVITRLVPAAAVKGSTFTLEIVGSGLAAGTTVNFGDVTGLVSVPAGLGTISTIVTTPNSTGTILVSVTVNGKTSNSLPFQVTLSPPPVLCSLTPGSVTARGQEVDLIVKGRNVATGAQARLGTQQITMGAITGIAASTDDNGCTSDQSIAMTVPGYPTTTLTSVGVSPPREVGVVNPDNGSSNTLPFLVTNPTPFLSDLDPNTAAVGTADKFVTVSGSDFVAEYVGGVLTSRSLVRFDGVPLTSVEPFAGNPTNQLKILVPASLLTTAKTYQVDVFNPGPGGGSSLTRPFQVVANDLPPQVVVHNVPILPEDQSPTVVAIVQDATSRTGVVGVGNKGSLRLIDLTTPAAPVLLPSPVVQLLGDGFDQFGDMVAIGGLQKAVVVSLTDTDEIALVNFSTAPPTVKRYQLAGETFPRGLAVDRVNGKLLVTGLGWTTLHVFDLLDPDTDPAIDLDSMVTVDLTDLGEVPDPPPGESLTIPSAPILVAVNPANGTAAILDRADPDPGQIVIANYTTSPGVKRLVPTGDAPGGVAVNPTTNEAVVSLEGVSGVPSRAWVVNLGTGVVRAEIAAGTTPQGVAIDPDTNRAIVINEQNNELTGINLNPTVPTVTRLQLAVFSIQNPTRLVWDPASGAFLAATLNGQTNNAIVGAGVTPGLFP